MAARLIILVALIVGSVGAFMYFAEASPEAKQQRLDGQVIADCRKRIDDPITPAGTRAALQTMCSGLLGQYRSKYGREP